MKIYLGGPFFNEPQRACIKELEDTLSPHGEVFSPSRDSVIGTLKPDASPEDRLQVLKENFEQVEKCDLMVAVYDFLLPENHKLMVVEEEMCGGLGGTQLLAQGPQLHLPDQGTVWEMGVAYTEHKPIIIFAQEAENINVMLAESALAVCRSHEELTEAVTILVGAGQDPQKYAEAVALIQSKFKYTGTTH